MGDKIAFLICALSAACSTHTNTHHDACVLYDGYELDYDTALKLSYGFSSNLNGCANLAKAWIANQPYDTGKASCVCRGSDSDEVRYTVKSFATERHGKCSHISTERCMCGKFYHDLASSVDSDNGTCWSIPQYGK